ncbi:MAG: hypothetical protein Q4E51_05185 [Lachnospiraceae bacterium]|nr:hypothetical protein [Lachnospiraceae bacterium]
MSTGNIIIASEKLKLFEIVESWSEYAGYSKEWQDKFWQDLLLHKDVYDEFIYYVEKNDFLCKCSVNGQFITDIFIWEMRKFNIKTDRGRNYEDCDKAEMILNAFRTMLDMKENSERVINAMENKNGADKL